jgi:hypothetical protein
MGYVIVGIIAFILGILTSVLAIHVWKTGREDREKDKK